MCPKPFRKPRSRSMRMEPEPLPPPVCYCVPWFLCFDVISNPQSLDVQQDPSSVLMILICLYSLSHFSCDLARPIFSSVDDCGQTVPVSHQTQSYRYTHVQCIVWAFLLFLKWNASQIWSRPLLRNYFVCWPDQQTLSQRSEEIRSAVHTHRQINVLNFCLGLRVLYTLLFLKCLFTFVLKFSWLSFYSWRTFYKIL